MSVKHLTPSRVFVGTVKSQKIQLETLLRISQHGDGAYLFLPRDVVDVYHLLPGDRVKVKLVESFRLISGLDKEKKEAVREEKVEAVLAIPRQKRRREKKHVVEDEFKIEKQSNQAEETTEVIDEEGPLLAETEGRWKEEE
jgi:antitoxin component of MazEF toxin-antitoxin module